MQLKPEDLCCGVPEGPAQTEGPAQIQKPQEMGQKITGARLVSEAASARFWRSP